MLRQEGIWTPAPADERVDYAGGCAGKGREWHDPSAQARTDERDLAGAVRSEGETCGRGAILDAEFRENPLEIFADRSRF